MTGRRASLRHHGVDASAPYSQVGAASGLGLLWSTIAVAPMAAAVQETVARLGLATGKGLAALIRERFARPILYLAD